MSDKPTMIRLMKIVPMLILIAAALVGCSKEFWDGVARGMQETEQNMRRNQMAAQGYYQNQYSNQGWQQSSSPTYARGEVKVFYGDASSPALVEFQRDIQKGNHLGPVASALQAMYKFPTTVTLAMVDCGKVNAYYDVTTKTVTLCYELIKHLKERALIDYGSLPKKAQMLTGSAAAFFLWHELGHAMIDLFQLNFTGREEDVADQLAAFGMLHAMPNTKRNLMNAALWFFEKGETNLAEEALADEHSLDKQRFYNVMCWAYGSDPDTLGYLAASLKGRADRCEDEFRKMATGIRALIQPHIDYAAARDIVERIPDSPGIR
jgi:hypothetical protein